ncbi:hypothetical protein Tcan_14719 [Toxocara canis]|uniref:Uncharacterized protein n=1 Tax=Toxocara canis TaxID=6265 RepID=A0A0B2V093_TOXCA|nr:hypothetical protein Tcan_14719 [Toxocara canis]
MAVGCFDPPLLNDEHTTLWAPANSSTSPTSNLFQSCWSPIPNHANTSSWHSVYSWINNTQKKALVVREMHKCDRWVRWAREEEA